jgi:beta-xylosidase
MLAIGLIIMVRPVVTAQNATNPVIYADVPDVSMIRVGDTYYMSSTTMHMNPGVPIMKSKDLVNWDLVNYCYESFDNIDRYNLDNGKNEYGHGSWASSLRYHKGQYYVATFANTGKTYIYRTSNIETGPWTVSVINTSFHDCSLFFDDDDRTYLIYGNGDIKIIELTSDATAIKPGGLNRTLIVDGAAIAGSGGLRAEGTHVQKINGYYYVSNICWPNGSMRTQIVHRSTSLTGPYEGRVILRDLGVAQGAFIDTPDGKWYAYLFRDFGSVGRTPYLVPMTWSNGWPVLSPVPATLDIPRGRGGFGNIVVSDEFDNLGPLQLAWQWNHNPRNQYWSLSQRPGYLRLTNERTDPNVLMTTNTLTQRSFGPKSTAYTALDVSGMKAGDYAGLIALQKQYGYVGVRMTSAGKSIVMVTGDDVNGVPVERANIPLNQTTVYLRIDMDFTNRTDKAYFYYSLNGTNWTAIGTTLQMAYTIPHFMGYRFGLFSYATQAAGGYADFDYFRVGTSVTSIFQNGPSVSITNPVSGRAYMAGDDIEVTASASVSNGTITKVEFYNGTTLLGSDNSFPFSVLWPEVPAGTYTLRAVATDNQGRTAESAVTFKVNVPQGPYSGSWHVIPGTIKLEHFDVGGNGFAYMDSSPGSETGVSFRTDEDVDIEVCTDEGGGYNIGWATAGEWLEYSVDVKTAGTYELDLRVAANGTDRTLSVSMDGKNIAGNVAIPNTGGWQTWQTVTVKNVNLAAGKQIMRVTIGATDYVNMNYVTFRLIKELKKEPFHGTAHLIPSRIEAEEYDFGGEGLAYHEANENGNEGGSTFRNDEVDVEETQDVGGGYNVGYILRGEWLEYTVNVAASGTYDLDVRVAADGTNKSFHIEMDGVDVTGPINVPNTGGWQTWQTVTVNNIQLTAGQQVMRVVFDSDYMNLNYIQFNDVVTGVLEEGRTAIAIYPNPFQGDGLHIRSEGTFTYRIVDVNGLELEAGRANDEFTAGLNLNPGVYMVLIQNGQSVLSKRIVKLK